MGKVTESIFDGGTAVIPLAEVCHVSKFANYIEIYFKSGRQLNLVPPDQNAFLVAWCRYRVELEADTLMDFEEAHPAPSVPKLHVGNLPTVNQDDYPGLGAWWVQLWDGDSVFARVYGASPEEARIRASMLAAAPEAKP